MSANGREQADSEALVEQIRGIIGSDTQLSHEQILVLLQEANNDPNKAVDLYFQQSSVQEVHEENQGKQTDLSLKNPPTQSESLQHESPTLSEEAKDLNDLLGGSKSPEFLNSLLARSNYSVDRAVDMYFSDQNSGANNEVGGGHGETSSDQRGESDQMIHAHPLVPLSPPHPAPDSGSDNKDQSPEAGHEVKPGTYEVVVEENNLEWKIGNVFGRVVVQWVNPTGLAARLGIRKSDVLLSIRDNAVTEKNCNTCVEMLSKEINLPMKLTLRRSTEHHLGNSNDGATEDGNGVNANTFHGFGELLKKVSLMCDAVGVQSKEVKLVVDMLMESRGNVDVAVNDFLSDKWAKQDLRRVVGNQMDTSNPTKCFGSEPYEASIPAGPLGLVVENILERTIVVDIKQGGAAERADVKRKSWLLSINGAPVTHLTHRETLRMIETATRPLELRFVEVPTENYNALRKQISECVRQTRTERPIPEQDRMSFRVFQAKIELVIEALPKCMVTALFQYLTREEFHQPSAPGTIDPDQIDELFPDIGEIDAQLLLELNEEVEKEGPEVSTEVRFLVNMFRSIHEHDDRGESLVIRTIKFLGLLAKKCARIKHNVELNEMDIDSEAVSLKHRYTILLGLLLHVLEKISIIENHATWDAMIASMKLVLASFNESEVDQLIVPVVSRLCVSPSPTARIVPAAIAPMMYPQVHGDVCVQIRGLLDRMFNDENPLVRRAVTSILGDFVDASGLSSASWGVLLLEKATSDSHDLVRIFAVRTCAQMANVLRNLYHAEGTDASDKVNESLQLLLCQLVPMVNTYVSDSSWHVRYELAATLPLFCASFGPNYRDVFVDYYVSMANDRVLEVKQACAESAFDLASAVIDLAKVQDRHEKESSQVAETEVNDIAQDVENLHVDEKTENPSKLSVQSHVVDAQSKIIRSILPAAYKLSTESSLPVRLSLAKSVGKCMQLVKSSLYEDFIPIITHLLNEPQKTIRAALVEEMARNCENTSPTVKEIVFPCIESLVDSPDWRVRVKAVDCLAAWAERCDQAGVPEDLADACIGLLKDPVFEVRAVCCSKLPLFVKLLGADWMERNLIPRILDSLQSNFNGRQTGLLALENLVPHLKETEKLREMIETVVEECTSTVANMRFRALRTLGLLLPALDDVPTTESILEIVRELTSPEHEVDRDVRETALQVQETLEKYLASQRSSTEEPLPET